MCLRDKFWLFLRQSLIAFSLYFLWIMSSCFLVCFCCCFSLAFVFSLTLWYFSIDLELTSVRPKGQIPLRWILHYLFTHRQIAQWMDVPGLGGHNQIFSMQIRTLSFLKLSVASLLFRLEQAKCHSATEMCIRYSCILRVCCKS